MSLTSVVSKVKNMEGKMSLTSFVSKVKNMERENVFNQFCKQSKEYGKDKEKQLKQI